MNSENQANDFKNQLNTFTPNRKNTYQKEGKNKHTSL
jgi:hypothetical protein